MERIKPYNVSVNHQYLAYYEDIKTHKFHYSCFLTDNSLGYNFVPMILSMIFLKNV